MQTAADFVVKFNKRINEAASFFFSFFSYMRFGDLCVELVVIEKNVECRTRPTVTLYG